VIGEVQRHPSVAIAQRLDADPDHFTRRCDRIQIGRVVEVDPRRQDLRFED